MSRGLSATAELLVVFSLVFVHCVYLIVHYLSAAFMVNIYYGCGFSLSDSDADARSLRVRSSDWLCF